MAIDLKEARDLLNNRPSSSKGDGGGYRWFNLPDEGSTKFRVAPPWEGSKVPGKIVSKHWGIPEIGSIYCFNTWGIECNFCKLLNMFSNKLDISPWAPSHNSYLNVVPRDGDYDKTLPYIMRSSDYTLYWLLEKVLDPEVGDITDPQNGHDITYKRKSKNGPFDRTITLAPSPIHSDPDIAKSILESIYDLDKIFHKPDDNLIKQMQETVQVMEQVINDRILELGNTSGNTGELKPSKEVKEENKAAESTETKVDASTDGKEETKTEDKSNGSTDKPAGAPDCFGKEHDEESKKCCICPYEFYCCEQ